MTADPAVTVWTDALPDTPGDRLPVRRTDVDPRVCCHIPLCATTDACSDYPSSRAQIGPTPAEVTANHAAGLPPFRFATEPRPMTVAAPPVPDPYDLADALDRLLTGHQWEVAHGHDATGPDAQLIVTDHDDPAQPKTYTVTVTPGAPQAAPACDRDGCAWPQHQHGATDPTPSPALARREHEHADALDPVTSLTAEEIADATGSDVAAVRAWLTRDRARTAAEPITDDGWNDPTDSAPVAPTEPYRSCGRDDCDDHIVSPPDVAEHATVECDVAALADEPVTLLEDPDGAPYPPEVQRLHTLIRDVSPEVADALVDAIAAVEREAAAEVDRLHAALADRRAAS